eukprot:12954170-Heterocapsa_arctica.AAC.1
MPMSAQLEHDVHRPADVAQQSAHPLPIIHRGSCQLSCELFYHVAQVRADRAAVHGLADDSAVGRVARVSEERR